MTKRRPPLTTRDPGVQRFHMPADEHEHAAEAFHAKRDAFQALRQAKGRIEGYAQTLQATEAACSAAESDFVAASTVYDAQRTLAEKLGRPEDVQRAKEAKAAQGVALNAFSKALDNRAAAKAGFEQAVAGLKQARERYEAVMRPEGSES